MDKCSNNFVSNWIMLLLSSMTSILLEALV
jgi:hypothetical protein